MHQENVLTEIDEKKITRIEVHVNGLRELLRFVDGIDMYVQDDERTLKIFCKHNAESYSNYINEFRRMAKKLNNKYNDNGN
jgi:hypothetical protein